MGRMIDVDKLGLTDFEIVMCNGDYKEALKMLIEKIENAPTVDAEPVIRCKDCRFYNTHDHRCVRMNHGFKDDFFCSWGERKDE